MPHVRAPSVSTFLRILLDRVVRVVRFGVLGTRARTCMYSTLAWPVPRSSHVPLDSSLYTLTRCIACASTCASVDEAQHEEWRTCTCVAVSSAHRFASIEICLPVIAIEEGKISIKLREISMGAGTERTRWETGRDVDETGERSRWEMGEISMGGPGRPSRSKESNGCRVAAQQCDAGWKSTCKGHASEQDRESMVHMRGKQGEWTWMRTCYGEILTIEIYPRSYGKIQIEAPRHETERMDAAELTVQDPTNMKFETRREGLCQCDNHQRGSWPCPMVCCAHKLEGDQPRLRLALCLLSWMNLSVLGLLRVLFPLVGLPHGVTEGLPPEVFPSPPP